MRKIAIILLLALIPSLAESKPKVRVDKRIPAGNVVVERVSGDSVFVAPDLTGNAREWFYWAMRVRGAQGRTLVFQFPRKCVGARGPVISSDKGKTFRFGGGRSGTRFSYAFGPDEREVWFYECHPYLQSDWKKFTRTLDGKRFRQEVLCLSRSGKKVPVATFGRLDGRASSKVVVTARHHCSESLASFVMEGLAQACCADDPVGNWLRENVELSFVPFVDYDGVLAGDQGKNRSPHDHNRDYGPFLYPETRAVAELYVEKAPQMVLDLHCPWISGKNNEKVFCPLLDPAIVQDPAAEDRFAELMEKNAQGLPYKADNDTPYRPSANPGSPSDGISCRRWAAANLKGLRVCRCFEIPFANAQGTEVTPDACRTFGRSIAATVVEAMKEWEKSGK